MISIILMLPTLPLTDPVYVFCLLLLLIGLAPSIAARFRLPNIVVFILLGTLVGSHGLGILARDAQLILLERIGLLYIMLFAGIQMDVSNFKRIGSRAGLFGALTFGLPFAIGLITGYLLTHQWTVAVLLGILYSPHTLMSYPIVVSLGISQTEAVAVAVGGSVVTTILTLTTYAILQATQTGHVGAILWLKLLIFLPLVIAGCFWLVPQVGRGIAKVTGRSLEQGLVFVWSVVFLTAALTHLLGVDAIVGAFVAGLALNRLIPLHSDLMRQIEIVGNSLFIPAFAISIGVLCNPTVLFQHPENLGIAGLILLGAGGGKFLAAWLAGTICRYRRANILTMFGLTVSRSALVLVIALFGKNAGLLQEGMFNAVLVYIMVTCLVGPLITDRFGQAMANEQVSLQESGALSSATTGAVTENH